MNKIYKKHVFVCENKRNDSSRKSCGEIGAQIRIKLKREIQEKGLNKEIRINRSGCLGKCGRGPCIVLYSKGDWAFNVQLKNIEEIVSKLVSE
tara:strand:+ start:184 stop:462 length:279 start_codon:yes stop_codon:yes gene_type:complete